MSWLYITIFRSVLIYLSVLMIYRYHYSKVIYEERSENERLQLEVVVSLLASSSFSLIHKPLVEDRTRLSWEDSVSSYMCLLLLNRLCGKLSRRSEHSFFSFPLFTSVSIVCMGTSSSQEMPPPVVVPPGSAPHRGTVSTKYSITKSILILLFDLH